MIKNRIFLFGLIIFGLEVRGMDDSNIEEDWVLLHIGNAQEVSIFDKFRDFFSKQDSLATPNTIHVQPTINLPEEIILHICTFMLKDWRDIFSFFRTTSYYHKTGKNTVKIIKSTLGTLDLEFVSRMKSNLFLVKMIEYPSAYSKLTTLNLSRCGIGDAKRYSFYFSNQKKMDPRRIAISYIAKLKNLTHLDLSHNHLSDEIMSHNENLIQLVRQLPLHHLDLGHNNLGLSSMEHLAIGRPEKLIFLNLSFNNLSHRNYSYSNFVFFVQNTSKGLTHLNLSGTDGCKLYEDLMARENQITYLDISHNDLEYSSELFVRLKHNTILKHLDLSHSKMKCHYVEFLSNSFVRRGDKHLAMLMKFFKETLKDMKKEKGDTKGDLREWAHEKLLLLAERNRESGNIFLAEDLLNAWDFRFNDDQMKKIMDILEPMNVSLTHLNLRGVRLGKTNQDLARLKMEFRSIPGLGVDLSETYYSEYE